MVDRPHSKLKANLDQLTLDLRLKGRLVRLGQTQNACYSGASKHHHSPTLSDPGSGCVSIERFLFHLEIVTVGCKRWMVHKLGDLSGVGGGGVI